MSTDLLPDKKTAATEINGNEEHRRSDAVGRLAVGASISLVGKIAGRGIDFTKQVVLARLLSVEAFGLYALIWNLLRIVGILGILGLQNGVVQFAMPFHQKEGGKFKDVILRALVLSLTVAIGVSGLLWVSAPWLAANLFDDPGFTPAFRVFVFILPPMIGLRVAANATRISQRMQYAIYAEELLQSISALLLFLLFFMAGWQLFGAILAATFSYVLAFVLICYYLYRLFPTAFRQKRQPALTNKTLLTYSIPTAFASMFGVVVNRFDRLFIGYYLSTAEVGVYQAAAQFSIVFALVLDGFNSIFSPMIVDLYYKGHYAELQDIFRISTKWAIYVNLPFFLVIFLAPASFMEAVFGPAYLAGAIPLVILTAGQAVNISVGGVGMMLVMTGRQKAWFVTSGSMMLLSIVLNVTLIPRWGIVGAAVATAVTISLLFILGLLQVRFLLHLWPYDGRYKKGLLAAAVAIAGILLMRLFWWLPPLPDVLFTTLLSGALFFGTLLLLGLDEEDKTFLRALSAKIGQRKRR
jgi:O-antigen/teichoic acid export membrane protein